MNSLDLIFFNQSKEATHVLFRRSKRRYKDKI